MSSYLVIKNNTQYKSYTIKSTHTRSSYIKVGSYGYLDLTTNTQTGINLKVKKYNTTFRPVETYTTTAVRSSEYTKTTGYSGTSSKESTSGYSGKLSRESTSSYSGSKQVATAPAKTVTSRLYGTQQQTLTRDFTHTSVSTVKQAEYFEVMAANSTSKRYQRSVSSTERSMYTYTAGGSTARYSLGASVTNSSSGIVATNTLKSRLSVALWGSTTYFNNTTSGTWSHTSPPNGVTQTITLTVRSDAYATVQTNKGLRYNQICNTWWVCKTTASPVYYNRTGTRYRLGTMYTQVDARQTFPAIGGVTSSATVGTFTKTVLTTTIGAATTQALSTHNAIVMTNNYTATATSSLSLIGATPLTRSSAYDVTSSAIGNLSSITTLTRTSYYNSTSTNVGNLSYTTALTTTSQRASQYNTTTEI